MLAHSEENAAVGSTLTYLVVQWRMLHLLSLITKPPTDIFNVSPQCHGKPNRGVLPRELLVSRAFHAVPWHSMVGVMSFSLAVMFSLTGHSNPNSRSLSGCKVQTLPGAWTVPLRTRSGARELRMGFIS